MYRAGSYRSARDRLISEPGVRDGVGSQLGGRDDARREGASGDGAGGYVVTLDATLAPQCERLASQDDEQRDEVDDNRRCRAIALELAYSGSP